MNESNSSLLVKVPSEVGRTREEKWKYPSGQRNGATFQIQMSYRKGSFDASLPPFRRLFLDDSLRQRKIIDELFNRKGKKGDKLCLYLD